MNNPKDLIQRINADLWRMSYILESETQSGYSEIVAMMRFYGFKYENRIGITIDFENFLVNAREKLKTDWEAYNI